MLRAMFPGVPIVAVTATATGAVQQDVVKSLGLEAPRTFREPNIRPNLFYEVFSKDHIEGMTGMRHMLSLIRATLEEDPTAGGVVYVYKVAICPSLDCQLTPCATAKITSWTVRWTCASHWPTLSENAGLMPLPSTPN